MIRIHDASQFCGDETNWELTRNEVYSTAVSFYKCVTVSYLIIPTGGEGLLSDDVLPIREGYKRSGSIFRRGFN